MDYVIERMSFAGCDEIRVVTRPEKRDVISHAAELRAIVLERHPDSLADSIHMAVQDADDDDVALLGFPDSIWEPVDGFSRLLSHIEAGRKVVLGLFTADLGQKCDVVETDENDRVRRIDVKADTSGHRRFWGCAAVRVGLLRGLHGWQDPGLYFHDLATRHVVMGVWLSADYIDIGTRSVLERFRDPLQRVDDSQVRPQTPRGE
jgi:glucose-1-phosphate thymidylyltransferase